jgi:hypothetical protein
MARALGVNIVSTFDSKGIRKAVADFQRLEGAGNKATFGLRTIDGAFTNGAKNIAKYGGLLAAGLGAVALHMVKGAELAKQADDRLVAVANSMGLFGAQAQMVTGRLIKLADAQEYELGVTAETIKLTQAKLLTFKELAVTADEVGGAFDRATVAAVDLAAAGFGEASQNATQLGKALNDPIKGITALARSGVTFTAQEKEKIKVLVESGKMLEAQDTLLKAIETQVGGTAAATVTDTFKIGAAFGHIRDVIGTLLLPIFERFANFMVNTVVPYATKVEEAFSEDGVAGGLRMLADGFLNVIEDGGKFVNTLLVLTAAFVAMRGVAIAATIAQNLFNVALLNNPIGRVVAILIVLGTAVVAAYLKFEGFRKVVNAVINFVIGYLENMVNIYIKGINLIITAFNLLIKAANFFGAGLPEIAKIGEVSFGRISSAAKKTESQLNKTLGLIQSARNAERLDLGGGPKFTGSGDDEDLFGGGGGGGESPIEKAKKALQKYTDAIKGVTQAQRSLRDANKSVDESNKSLLEKTKALAEAQKRFNLVTKGFGRESKEAKNAEQERTKAERSAERAKYALEEAIFAIKDAEDELAKVRQDPASTPQMIREAEIRLAQAKLSVADATDDQRDSVNALTAAQEKLDEVVNGAKEGSDAYKDALAELLDAEKAQRDAIDARTQAYEKQADAVAKLTEAEKDRYESGLALSKKAKAQADAAADSGVVVVPEIVIGGGGGGGGTSINDLLAQIALAQQTTYVGGGGGIGGLLGNVAIPFADGGIVTKAMLGLVGEAGAEAIIPLDRMGSFGSTYNIQVTAGMGADGKDIGTQIVNALKRYERTNGALPLTVA